MNCSHSAANTAIASRGFLDRRKFNGELEGATVAVAIVGLLFFTFCHLQEYCYLESVFHINSMYTGTIAGSTTFIYPYCLRQVTRGLR